MEASVLGGEGFLFIAVDVTHSMMGDLRVCCPVVGSVERTRAAAAACGPPTPLVFT